MSKISPAALLFVLFVVTIILVLVTSMPSDGNRRSLAKDEPGKDVADNAIEPPVDELGRWIVLLGDVELRIPKNSRTGPLKSSVFDIYPEALCLQPHVELSDCLEVRDRIQIFLMARPLNTPMPACNIGYDYAQGELDGPFATTNADVILFRDASGTTRRYVYREADEICRHPIARCNALRCISSFIPQPGVRVRYEFDESAVRDWPILHQRVRNHVTPLYAWR